MKRMKGQINRVVAMLLTGMLAVGSVPGIVLASEIRTDLSQNSPMAVEETEEITEAFPAKDAEETTEEITEGFPAKDAEETTEEITEGFPAKDAEETADEFPDEGAEEITEENSDRTDSSLEYEETVTTAEPEASQQDTEEVIPEETGTQDIMPEEAGSEEGEPGADVSDEFDQADGVPEEGMSAEGTAIVPEEGEVFSEEDTGSDGEILPEEEKSRAEEILPEEEKSRAEEILAEEGKSQAEEILPEEEGSRTEEILPEEEKTQAEEILPEEEGSRIEEPLPVEENTWDRVIVPEEDIESDQEILSDEAQPETAFEDALFGSPSDPGVTGGGEDMESAASIELDTEYSVGYNQGKPTFYKFTAPETGYYSFTARGNIGGEAGLFVFHFPETWYSQNPQAREYRLFMLEGFTYYLEGYTYNPDEPFVDNVTFEETYPTGITTFELSKDVGFSGFVEGCASWEISGEGETKITFPAVTRFYDYSPVKITVAEDGNYRFTSKHDINASTGNTWPVLLDEAGAVIAGPYDRPEETGEVGANLAAGKNYYLISHELYETAETVVDFTGAYNDPQQSDYCTDGHPHMYEDTIVPATFEANGSFSQDCPNCGKRGEQSVIPRAEAWLEDESFEYTGDMIEPEVTVSAGGTTLNSGYYTVEYSNNVDVGSGTALITLTDAWYQGTKTLSFTIVPQEKSDQVITASDVSKTFGDASFTLSAKTSGNGSLSFKSGNTAVAAVNSSTGLVTIKGAGTAVITITAAETDEYNKASKNVTVTVARAKLAAGNVTVASGTFTYNGNAQTPAVTVKSGTVTLKKDTDYTLAYSNNTNAGTAKATVTGKGNYTGTVAKTFTIAKAAQTLTVKAGASSVAVGKTTTVSITGAKGTKSFKSSDTTIATVTSAGTVTALKVGTVTITATSASTSNYKAASKTVTIKVVPAAATTLTLANMTTGIKLTWSKVTGATGYRIYREDTSGKTLIKKISGGSTLTYTDTAANTNGRKYRFYVYATAGTGMSTLSKSRATYRLAKPAVSSVTNSAASKMTVKWGKNSTASGYSIQYSLSSSFASGNKTVTAAGASTVSKVIASLTKGKTYYVRIRTYKTVDNVKYWSAWSASKSVKISK
ncbi:MAG: hypothetical protein IJH81_07670 [Lachnospiraceae bacterium]|nr:hypothetical protein [Lachnospiraceae bacterium]